MFGFLIACFIVAGQMSHGDNYITFSLLMPFMAMSAIATGITTSIRPSLLGVAPFTPRQRVVFSYLATAIRSVVFCVICTAAITVGLLFVALVAFIISGENMLVVTDSLLPTPGAYGLAHDALYWIILIFSAYAIAHINGNKARNITTAIFVAVAEALTLALVNVCGHAEQAHNIATGVNDGLLQNFFMSSDVSTTIDYLAHPWAVILVESMLAAAAIGASLFFSIKRYKSSKI